MSGKDWVPYFRDLAAASTGMADALEAEASDEVGTAAGREFVYAVEGIEPLWKLALKDVGWQFVENEGKQ